jgi:pimeloyl-ACP methyl ester carboxylesterase
MVSQPQAVTRGAGGALRQVDAGVLDVGYVDAGPNNGPVAMLLHGWPYDIHSFVDQDREGDPRRF